MDTGRGAALDFSGVRLHGYDRWPYQQIADVIEQTITPGAWHTIVSFLLPGTGPWVAAPSRSLALLT